MSLPRWSKTRTASTESSGSSARSAWIAPVGRSIAEARRTRKYTLRTTVSVGAVTTVSRATRAPPRSQPSVATTSAHHRRWLRAGIPANLHVMRLDKWLWAARFFKTRSLATSEVDGGHVEVNGERAKPAKQIRMGDELRIRINQVTHIIHVRG